MVKNSRLRFLLTVLIILAVFTGVFSIVATNRYAIVDWFRLRGYHPSAMVTGLASQDTMTSYARKVFYVSYPVVEAKASFTQCKNTSEKTIVLGCYLPGPERIYLLGVSDPRLNGVEQVTAAHETLHAVYERLSSKQKSKVNAMLLDYYHHDLHDQRILQTIALYKQSEPNDVVNEMHSVFGTEIADLPPGLEQYYSRYFSDRAKVVSYASSYKAEFTSRRGRADALLAQIKSLEAQITSLDNTLTTEHSHLQSQPVDLHSQPAVNQYNSQVDQYNSGVDRYKDLIAEHNALVDQYNTVVVEENQLINDISTNVTPVNSQ